MPSEIEEIVAESIEEIAVDDLMEKQKETAHEDGTGHNRKPRWELWVAMSSSLLAVVSAMAALLATFASDEAVIALSNEADYAAYAEGVDTNHAILKSKLDILASLGRQATPEDVAELQRIDEMAKSFRERALAADEEGQQAFRIHDRLAIAVTLFQVTMLLGGLSVMVERAAIWRFGLIFTAIGLVFLVYGLAGYLA